jgi:hypothetical protein
VSGKEKKEEKMKGKLMGVGLLYPSFLSCFLHPPSATRASICFFVRTNIFFAGTDLGLGLESLTTPPVFALYTFLFYFIIF